MPCDMIWKRPIACGMIWRRSMPCECRALSFSPPITSPGPYKTPFPHCFSRNIHSPLLFPRHAFPTAFQDIQCPVNAVTMPFLTPTPAQLGHARRPFPIASSKCPFPTAFSSKRPFPIAFPKRPMPCERRDYSFRHPRSHSTRPCKDAQCPVICRDYGFSKQRRPMPCECRDYGFSKRPFPTAFPKRPMPYDTCRAYASHTARPPHLGRTKDVQCPMMKAPNTL
jgi:hypothetical protein